MNNKMSIIMTGVKRVVSHFLTLTKTVQTDVCIFIYEYSLLLKIN